MNKGDVRSKSNSSSCKNGRPIVAANEAGLCSNVVTLSNLEKQNFGTANSYPAGCLRDPALPSEELVP